MSIELTVIIAVVSGLIGYFTFQRNRDKDVKSQATETAVMTTKLDSISQGVESIRVDMKVSERTIASISERVIRVEEGVKQAQAGVYQVNLRVDKVEGERRETRKEDE